MELEQAISELTCELREAQETINYKDQELLDLKRKRVDLNESCNENNRSGLRDITLKVSFT